MLEKDPRSTTDKIRLFRARFSGLDHVYGTYDPASGNSWQVKHSVTDTVVLIPICSQSELMVQYGHGGKQPWPNRRN
jgi:hypothetical protein